MYNPLFLTLLWKILSLTAFVASFQSTKPPAHAARYTLRRCLQPDLSSTSDEIFENEATDSGFYLRDARYNELGQVADVIIGSFYENTTTPWKQMFRVAELNRIQQSFPFENEKSHWNIVAVTVVDGKELVVGFCDLDSRLPNRNTGYSYNPRPYVSDLCIAPQWRRKGVAKAIIRESERICQEMVKEEVYIRVESSNEKALKLYEGLGYRQIPNPDSPKKQILLLRKELRVGMDLADKVEAER
jgi:ribosomal protein S18 acetylase RimI-like enzyme